MRDKTTIRKVPEGSLLHIYKITVDGGVLFYRTIDHLVYYTIQSVMARRHNLSVLVSCHMFTHTHDLCAPVDPAQIARYEQDVNSVFAREYNRETGRKGQLFKKPFGSAAERGDKDKRSALVYILNNPVEKKLCRHSDENRWTFLAYYEREFPFSCKPVLKECRWALRDAIRMVDQEYRAGRYLKYALLHKLFSGLNSAEKEILTDFILQRYFYFDKEACYSLFDSWEQMKDAADASKGKEFNVGEVFDPSSDIPYREMVSITERYGLLSSGLPLLRMQEVRRDKVADYLRRHTQASDMQIAKFLHCQSMVNQSVVKVSGK